MIQKKHTHHLSSRKIIHLAMRLFIVIALFVVVYFFFASVAAQPTSIRISETVADMGSARVTTTPATEFKEKKIDITRQIAGDVPITLSLSNVSDYTVVAGGVINSGTATLPAVQNALSVSIHFHPATEGVKTATLTITQGASISVKLTGRGVKSGTSPVCPSSYFPSAGQRDMPSSLTVQWSGAYDPDGGSVGYTVYLDDDKNVTTHSDGVGIPNVVKSGTAIGVSSSSYTATVSDLAVNTIYYWIVEVSDDEGSVIQCPRGALLSFMTQSGTTARAGIKYEFPTETIQFDPRIITNPPPGFTDERFRLPQTTEVIAN
ncbi:MAG TPA: hypothetical protein DCY49_02460 [Candidatus Jacksonbacteria bacterium]|nr:MAG: hypothetical protein A2986_01960 [Candidatus Jacksonbacteria bacterium RIFCSPLOWO2_01_FULL_44_13]HAZ16741.1 hypothetical protein [Candidatus Jacksonbacteria bacterium]